jgi:hypothetical protein
MPPRLTLASCEDLAQRLSRLGGFVSMHYRLFPDTRNSFSPNLLQLGFNFAEMRQVNATTELRFQLFPQDIVQPIRKTLEDLRAECNKLDEGPFPYTGDPFLTHDRINRFVRQSERTREQIRANLRKELLDNYESLREKARQQLLGTLQTLLPHLGVGNTAEVLHQSWFDPIFPSRSALSDDFTLRVRVYNIHPRELLEDARLRKEITRYVDQPRQGTLFSD